MDFTPEVADTLDAVLKVMREYGATEFRVGDFAVVRPTPAPFPPPQPDQPPGAPRNPYFHAERQPSPVVEPDQVAELFGGELPDFNRE